MEEKKSKLSLAVVLLVLAIIVIVVMSVFMYKLYNDKKAESEKVADLNRQTENLNSQINDLDLQIEELENQNTVLNEENSEEKNIEYVEEQTKTENYEDIVLYGRYGIPNTDSGWEFTEDGYAYSCGNMNVMKGTYKTIAKNKIEIHYIENRFWDEVTGEGREDVDVYDYITVDDDNTIFWTNPLGLEVELEKTRDTTPNVY